MIKVPIIQEQQRELELFQSLASSRDSKKALMVLLSSEGNKVCQIAKMLKRNLHTVTFKYCQYN